jgi:hypothetical protein
MNYSLFFQLEMFLVATSVHDDQHFSLKLFCGIKNNGMESVTGAVMCFSALEWLVGNWEVSCYFYTDDEVKV